MIPGRRAIGCAGLLVVLAGIAVVAGPLRQDILTAVANLLVVADAVTAADLAVVTPESGAAGDLQASDLYRNGTVKGILVLVPTPLPVDRELKRRGVHYPNLAVDTLIQLGVPSSAISTLEAGEGGTTENTTALSKWVLAGKRPRVIVIVSPTHARRYRRALNRVWPATAPPPTVTPTRYAQFQPQDWWRSRATLREGLMELEKLALDYIQHPLR
jgi:hypothetical protein